mmetsp:Transcript_23406/g.79275  ORF Transcript_23406/g.79275 Transcript_23406/m.79275 type:complete len:218 (+) Transcript_23406:567-1220(+)
MSRARRAGAAAEVVAGSTAGVPPSRVGVPIRPCWLVHLSRKHPCCSAIARRRCSFSKSPRRLAPSPPAPPPRLPRPRLPRPRPRRRRLPLLCRRGRRLWGRRTCRRIASRSIARTRRNPSWCSAARQSMLWSMTRSPSTRQTLLPHSRFARCCPSSCAAPRRPVGSLGTNLFRRMQSIAGPMTPPLPRGCDVLKKAPPGLVSAANHMLLEKPATEPT